jgi:hypothetical protein
LRDEKQEEGRTEIRPGITSEMIGDDVKIDESNRVNFEPASK